MKMRTMRVPLDHLRTLGGGSRGGASPLPCTAALVTRERSVIWENGEPATPITGWFRMSRMLFTGNRGARCSLSLVFPQLDVPSASCSLSPMFPQPDVPSTLCSLSLVFPHKLLSKWRGGPPQTTRPPVALCEEDTSNPVPAATSSLKTTAGCVPASLVPAGRPGSGVWISTSCGPDPVVVCRTQLGLDVVGVSAAPPLAPLEWPSLLPPSPLVSPASRPPWEMSSCGRCDRVVGNGGSCMGSRTSPLRGNDSRVSGSKPGPS
ncbi:hypothetical protein EYF80_040544 [Liparis tanakae]|uniref:Uncharacterized protein n=1 Tax=Liparis tanakae TaxID=230148 RepID=A0A4Z2G6R6_9TELE|nr:hypothetical protein EYF80_040544 [Liparis tanakae]